MIKTKICGININFVMKTQKPKIYPETNILTFVILKYQMPKAYLIIFVIKSNVHCDHWFHAEAKFVNYDSSYRLAKLNVEVTLNFNLDH